VGESYLSGGGYHAFRTAANQPINPVTDDLGTLGGAFSTAYGINNSGQVVGESYISGGGQHAFLYSGSGSMQDLNDLINPASGWTLNVARSINDLGQIVGSGTIGGRSHTFLLTPVPEPSTFVLLSIGILGLWAYAWRRLK
jgi:probable HAF family extracellular repeat protein